MVLDAAETVLGFLALTGLFTAILRGVMVREERNGGGMKN
jgi:hypothetical protein